MGYYGHFLPISKIATCVTPITLHVAAIHDGIHVVLNTALTYALTSKGHNNVQQLAADTAQTLTNGCMLLLYSRLRLVNRSYIKTSSTYTMRPPIPANFEVPTPYAVAIQYLGLFRVENLDLELELIPTVSAADADNYCLGTHQWDYSVYKNAIEFAKSLGISS